MTAAQEALHKLARLRWRMAITMSAVVVAIYFGFILLIAFNKPAMGSLLIPGLSIGIVLGALVIVVSWLITWVYVRWAERHVDAEVARLHQGGTAP